MKHRSLITGALLLLASPLCHAETGQEAVTLEGKFGKVEVDVEKPALRSLTLRRADGTLEPQSLLSRFPRHGEWLQGASTYVVDAAGVRHESRIASPEKVEMDRAEGKVTAVRLLGVKLSAAADAAAVALEDWTLTTENGELVWKIVRCWQRDLTYGLSGTPGMFSTFHSRSQKNALTSTLWYDPLYLDGRADPAYRQGLQPLFQTSINPVVDVTAPNTWATYKLWTNWNAQSDLRLAVDGGFLMRRGSYALVNESGAVTTPGASSTRTAGQVETTTLRISPVDKTTTGYQLNVSIPDKATESALKGFYSSLLNGGTVNDQKRFNFGNESDGWYVAFSAWMQTAAIGAGVPAAGKLSEHPLTIPVAYRDHLRSILDTTDDAGLTHFGYNHGGLCMDEHLLILIGARNYAVFTGDIHFLREQLPAMERILGYFIKGRNAQGLFDLSGRNVAPHWYYDTINISGVTTYHNSLFYKASLDLAEMERAVGNTAKAAEYSALAADLKTAINKVLWKEDAPGGPRYLDWIDFQGREVAYFCDLCQWTPLVYGVASPEQARKVVATADKRIVELQTQVGYKGHASMSALWPAPDFVNPEQFRAMQVFPIAMNGGSYLAMTYWEIVGRAKAGDREGAWKRMRLFAQRAARDGWAGFNCFGPDGELEERGRNESDGEPYLADMIAVPAALVNGILGVDASWDKIDVKPMLPDGWKQASAEIIYRGQRTRVEIKDGETTLTPVGPSEPMPPAWSLEGNFAAGRGWSASETIDLNQGRSVSLKTVFADEVPTGHWMLDESKGPALDSGPHARHETASAGTPMRGIAGRRENTKAAGFDGTSEILIADDGTFAFGPEQSFTFQCWFKTTSGGNQVLVSKEGSYCLGTKDEKLSAWVWGEGKVVREATGITPVADNRWHHVAAVFDRKGQQLTLYLDGKHDGNPADISLVGASHSAAPLTVGGLGKNYQFKGAIAGVSVHRGALTAEQFSFPSDHAVPPAGYSSKTAASGTYTSRIFDWGSPLLPTAIEVAATSHGGSVTLTLETSNDGFQTIAGTQSLPLRDGVQIYPLTKLGKPARQVRVTLGLQSEPAGKASPLVRGFRISAR